jgi:PAS domain S-box-containing protein
MNKLQLTLSDYIISPLFLLLLLGGLIGVFTFIFLFRFKKTPGVKYWLIWQIAASVWAFTYAFEFAATDIETKMVWSKFSYFGIVYCALSFFFFSLKFSSSDRYLNKKFIVAMFSIATIFLASPFTNELHHLHWKSYSINPETNAMNYVYGPFFWVIFTFSYLTLFSGIVNISLLFVKLSSYHRRQILLLFIASLLPPIGNLIYVFNMNPIPGFDWTPFTFLLTGILIAINISRYKMFDLVPFARNKLIDILPDAILIVDSSSRIADYNSSMRKLIDSNEKELIGKRIEEIVPHQDKLIDEIRRHDEFQSEISLEINGKRHYFDLQAITLYDHDNQQTGRLVMLKDITHRLHAEETIREANIRLSSEILEKEKLIADLDAFSHTVAHDLKNMLGAIVSASSMIKSDFDSFPKEDFLELNDLIYLSATKTMHITKELLTLASVRQEEINPRPVNMQKIVSDSITRLKDMIVEKSAQIGLPESWPKVLGYEAWLEEIWINYLSNAIKYGGIPPLVEFGCEILNENKAKFWIRDNGQGLSEEEMALLFNKFTRLDTLRAEGNGLGLSIVKRIVEKLNGEVGVESKNIPGEGSTFYFILPLAKSQN